MDERTVYLFARHNGLGDQAAAEFVAWFFDHADNEDLTLGQYLEVWREETDFLRFVEKQVDAGA